MASTFKNVVSSESIGDKYEESCSLRRSNVQKRTSNAIDVKEVFPKVIELLRPDLGESVPAINVEDWTDQSYYNHHGVFLEDLAGTGIHLVIENHPPCLKIDGQAYSKGINIFNYPQHIENIPVVHEITFTECYIGEIKIEKIELENVGPYVIRYVCKKIGNYENSSFPIKPSLLQEENFFIDSRPGILVPGEKKRFGIGFKSKFPGVYKEEWEYITVPTIHTNKIIFKFHGITSEKNITRPWNIFVNRLNRLQAENCAVDVLEEIFCRIFEALPLLKEPQFVEFEEEDEVFLHVNKDLYSYDQNVISELKDVHLSKSGERWCLNMWELEEKLLSSEPEENDIVKFKKNKLRLVKSERNVLPRDYYKTYYEIFLMIGDAMTELQTSVDKYRHKYGLKSMPPIPPSESPSYFFFPKRKIELISSTTTIKVDSKQTSKKQTGQTTSKTGGKTADKKGKKKEYIVLIPVQKNPITPTQWLPENYDYGTDVYKHVFQILGSLMDRIEQTLEQQKQF